MTFLLLTAYCLLFTATAFAGELHLQDLIDEALKNNHEILMSESKWRTAMFRIPQAESLPDPMFMIGYQNEGTKDLYTFGNGMMPDSQWMFSLSQMFPFPGKLSLKGEMALRDAEGLKAYSDLVRLKTIARVKELYYDLFFAHKSIDFIKKDKAILFSRIEDIALVRYSTGIASQQEVLMAQTEKYMLLEKEEMLKQKMQSLEAMLNATIGRDVNSPLGRPAELSYTAYNYSMEELLKTVYENSPEIKSREKMIAGNETKVQMAKKEYYPDFTFTASYFVRGAQFPDMWSLAGTFNIPIFYKVKQKQAVYEAESFLSEARHELEETKLMLSSAIRDNYSMLKTSERLMELYKNNLIPKTYQDFESALTGYRTGKTEAITVITRLKNLIDFETLYWGQFVEREKAIARLEAITGLSSQESEAGSQ
jgi:outer membrane protein TolC